MESDNGKIQLNELVFSTLCARFPFHCHLRFGASEFLKYLFGQEVLEQLAQEAPAIRFLLEKA